MESKLTAPETQWIGDESGEKIKGEYSEYFKNQFTDDNKFFTFYNYYTPSCKSGAGFMYTNKSDITTAGSENIAAITGKAQQGKVYLTVYASDATPPVITFADNKPHKVLGMFITNSTYAYLSMKTGDTYAKKFVKDDWFKLEIYGKNVGDTDTKTEEVYLADFRNGKTDMLNTWKWVELETLGEVKSIHFKLTSSDTGKWGMNTPAYFCMDGIKAVK